MTRWFVGWLGLVPLMIANGVVRVAAYSQRMSELAAHQVSTVTAGLVYGAYVYFLFDWLRISSRSSAWTLGATWLGLTVAFEFGFGHYVAGHSWHRLLADYDLLAGRVWLLFLLWVLVAPRVTLGLRRPTGRVTGRTA